VASGTYLRMILPSGTASGPYLSNSDSTCSDQSYTPLSPGTDGGLEIGGYQPTPSPAFDANGNALAKRITLPAQFYGTGFALATNPTDPQTGTKVPVPTITISGTKVTADLSSWAVTWNNQNFNQGSPKPDGSYPGNTRPAAGTYNPATGAITLDWTSQVVGGPFDKFTGSWHLVGYLDRSSGPATAAAAGGGAAAGSAAEGAAGTTITGTSGARGASGTSHTVTTKVAAKPGAKAGAAPAAGTNGTVDAAAVTSTQVVEKQAWHASWWLIAVVIALAVLGFGGIWLTSRKGTQA
jgi:hypothetical protein